MNTPPRDAGDRLLRAIEIHHRFLAEGGHNAEQLLEQNSDLRDLLEPLLGEEPHVDGSAEPPTIGDFRLEHELGRGAMGVVWAAEQISLGRRVALKLLPPHATLDARAVARFRREARLAASLDHPAITRVFGSGEHDGQHWFAMELVDGLPLSTLLQHLRSLPPTSRGADAFLAPLATTPMNLPCAALTRRVDLAVDLVIQIADALACAHAAGVVHRDIKPGNVLVRADGTAKLSDFGIARGDDAVTVTRTGDFAGTPSYCSPEQLRGRPDAIDHRTDLFSLGATLYETLTLARPFDADTVSEVRERIERHDPPPPSRFDGSISRDLDAIVLHALEKEPAKRYPSAAAFADDLRRWRDGRPVAARSLSRATRTWRWCRRNPVAASFLTTACAGLAVVTLLALDLQRQGALARERLVQFRSMKVERDVKLFKRALLDAQGPMPEHAAQLGAVVAMGDHLVTELPALRAVLDELRRSAVPEAAPPSSRLLAEHPAVEPLQQLRRDSKLIAARLQRLQDEELSTPQWDAQVAQRLAAMEAEAARIDALVQDRRHFAFVDQESEYLHDTVEDMIAEIEWLQSAQLPELRTRAARAAAAGGPLSAERAAVWQAAADQARRIPAYHGIDLAPQAWLMPLGADPQSGLLEFAQELSGEIPRRGTDGALSLDEGSAIVFVLIPGGETIVGSQPVDSSAAHFDPATQRNEYPPQVVHLDAFLLAKFELSHAQWTRLATGLGIHHQAAWVEGRPGFGVKPITRVTWTDCDRLCRANGLTMPTETQWEHACRARTDTPWWTGKEASSLRDQERVAVARQDYDRWPVYSGAANPFGLHHMHGNVEEWCADAFADESKSRDGDGLRSGASNGLQRSIRGGAYHGDAQLARSSMRNNSYAMDQKDTIGLRPARPLTTH
ncbi:MAG: SUMF1/EgtB/PvdO family nonheme iron enzyme [Planctomycetes bacterium]|nr:SUMF1/EgtB/PvdO family nonheme iron enzyme [Planctomycetota bacterium]